MIEVRKEVVAATDGEQVPWDHSALTGDFYFAPGAAAPSQGSVASAPTGTPADVAALQERLGSSRRSAKRREAAASPVAPPTHGGGARGNTQARNRQELPNFQIEDNVRIEGLKYSDQRQPNPAACRNSCEQDAQCVAFQHGRRSP